MDNQLNSSNLDSTTSVTLKKLFKKRKNAPVHFNVSSNLSPQCIQNNKIDMGSETSGKKKIFNKKVKNPNQNCFSVSFNNSQTEAENEQSVVSLKGKKLFRLKKNKSPFKEFNVSFNESHLSKNDQNQIKNTNSDIDIDSSVSVEKKNQFMKKKSKSQNFNFNVDFEETSNCSLDASSSRSLLLFNKEVGSSNPFKVSYDESKNQARNEVENSSNIDEDQTYTSTKGNPFKKPFPKTVNDVFHVEFDESTLDDNTEASLNTRPIFKKFKEKSLENFKVSFNNTSVASKVSDDRLNCSSRVSLKINNPEKESFNSIAIPEKLARRPESVVLANKESPSSSAVNTTVNEPVKDSERVNSFHKDSVRKESNISKDSVTETENLRHESSKTSQFVNVLSISRKSNDKNLNVSDKSEKFISKSGTSEMYLDQSSFNDENLNNWMSDHSDDDIHPPSVPDIGTNISSTKTKMPTVSAENHSQNSSNIFNWEDKVSKIVLNARNSNKTELTIFGAVTNVKKLNNKATKKICQEGEYRPPKLKKPAPFATKRLYQYIIKRLEPKFGVDSLIKAEELVFSICDTVKMVTRRRVYQRTLIHNLKKEMALAGIIETTVDFYEFVIKFLPHNFRVKVVPCIQPVTNTVFPPKDNVSPFEKIL